MFELKLAATLAGIALAFPVLTRMLVDYEIQAQFYLLMALVFGSFFFTVPLLVAAFAFGLIGLFRVVKLRRL